jgi:hypothetical protein
MLHHGRGMKLITHLYLMLRSRNYASQSQLGRRWARWENNIETCFKEMKCDGLDWINLVQKRVQWRVLMNPHWSFEFHECKEIF